MGFKALFSLLMSTHPPFTGNYRQTMDSLCMSTYLFNLFNDLPRIYLCRNKCKDFSFHYNSVALIARPKIELDMKKIKRTSAKYDFIAFEIFGT